VIVGYWCEVTAHVPESSWSLRLAGYQAKSPRTAVRWLRGRAGRLAAALDPEPGNGPIPARCLTRTTHDGPNPADVFRSYAADMWKQDDHMEALKRGRLVCVTAAGPDRFMGYGGDVWVFYELTARPLTAPLPTAPRAPEMVWVEV
jgi:hypothetical protein